MNKLQRQLQSYIVTALAIWWTKYKCRAKANIEKPREVLANEKRLNDKEVFKGVKTCVNGIGIKALEL